MTTQIRLPQTSFGTGFKNKLTNPKFTFWNRLPLMVNPDVAPGDDFFTINTGAFSSTSQVTADRWWVAMASPTSPPTVIVDQTNDGPPGLPYSMRVTMNTAEPATDTTYTTIAQKIEGPEAAELQLGVPGATTQFTISFWVKSSISGVYHIWLRNGYFELGAPDNTRSYVAPYTIDAADIWERKEITITTDGEAPTTWNWHTESGVGLEVCWNIYAGTDYQTSSPNQWNTENKFATTTQTAFATTPGATFQITGAQLEVGPHATPLESRPESVEADMCSHYYQRGNFAESMYGTYNASYRTNEKWVTFPTQFIHGRIPEFNAWIRYGGGTGIDPNAGGVVSYVNRQTVDNGTDPTGTFPYPRVFSVNSNAIYVQFGRHTTTSDCTLQVYWEADAELFKNE